MNVENILRSYYQDKIPNGRNLNKPIKTVGCYNKLGESIMLSSIPEKANKENKEVFLNKDGNFFLDIVLKNNTYHINKKEQFETIHHLVENFNCGNGNILQQIYRILGLEIDIKPKGNLYINKEKKKNLIGIHIDGISAGRFYPRGRSIYEENIKILQEFINDNSQYSFIQFGQGQNKREDLIPSGISEVIKNDKSGLLENVEDYLNKSLEDTFNKMAECEYFICLNSGFYHAAIALDIKTICIINLPVIEECYLPILVNEMLPCSPPYLKWDKNWLYPQAVHLHQDGENQLVKQFNYLNLKKALHGDIYPFWSDKYLSLIHE
jgi:hypothetical protein